MLWILIKTLISIPLRLLSHSLLLTTQIHSLLLLRLPRLCITFGKSGWLIGYVVLEEDTLFVGDCVLDGGLSFFWWLVRERWAGVLSGARRAHSIVVFGIKSSSNTWLMNLIPWIIRLILCFLNVLLELRIVLILHWDLLNVLGRLVVVGIYFYVLLIASLILIHVIQISSLNWLSTLVLWLFRTLNRSLRTLVLFFHISIQHFPLLKYLHQFPINLITTKLFQNTFLVVKLILWLLSLLSSLLFLD